MNASKLYHQSRCGRVAGHRTDTVHQHGLSSAAIALLSLLGMYLTSNSVLAQLQLLQADAKGIPQKQSLPLSSEPHSLKPHLAASLRAVCGEGRAEKSAKLVR